MMDRRNFLRNAAVTLSAASAFAGKGLAAISALRARPLGAQLYTVRDQAERDLPGTLAAIRAIGYQEVETYWNVYSHPAAELKRMIADHGLLAPSGHFDYDGLEAKLDYAAELGLHWVICPMLPQNLWGSLDGFQRAAEQFNKWGERINGMGMRFGFHNHDYEFRPFGNTSGFEVLMSQTDPQLMCLEMDCYWMTQAGQDPVAMLKKLGPRIELLHLKDRKPGFPISYDLNQAAEHFTPVGTGTIDWKAILGFARTSGVKNLFVEQDSGDLPAIESLKISYRNLQPLL
ncbi:MAG: sugar phosphate isomerase/epimerase [Candidatus Acidiferrales bacterium]